MTDPTLIKKRVDLFKRLKQDMAHSLYNANLNIALVGIKSSGKETLTRYLQTLLPEKDTTILTPISTSYTKSLKIKHISIGNSNLSIIKIDKIVILDNEQQSVIENSDLIIYIVDVTRDRSENISQVLNAINELLLGSKRLVILMNKMDIINQDKHSHFVQNILHTKNNTGKLQIHLVNCSIRNGIAYLKENNTATLAEILIKLFKNL